MAEDEVQLFTSLRYDPLLIEVPKTSLKHAAWNFNQASPYYMLDYHRDRMLGAATYWGWKPAIDLISGAEGLERLRQYADTAMADVGPEPRRLKINLSKDGVLSHEGGPVPARPLANFFPAKLSSPGSVDTSSDVDLELTPPYEVILDLDKTEASEFTHYKTTNRIMYDSARKRVGIVGVAPQEVLIVNHDDGSIMEGSTTTPYFWRGGRWVTPPVSSTYRKNGGSGGQDGTSRRWALERSLAVEEVVKADSVVEGEDCWLSNGVRGFIYGKIKQKQSAK